MPYSPSICLVPSPLWGENLRKVLPKSKWTKLRQELIAKRGLNCQTCGKKETESKRVKAHEHWEYNIKTSPAIAHLKEIVLSFWHCHSVEHFGATRKMVLSRELTERAIEDTIEHFCRLNNVGRKAFFAHEKVALAEWERLSKFQWSVDWGTFSSLVAATQDKRGNSDGEALLNRFLGRKI